MRFIVVAMLVLSACKEEQPVPRPGPPQVWLPGSPTAPAAPTEPQAGPPLPPVEPGSYVNHVGNPQAGHWGPDGQWVWNNPESKEANDTWKYLAAAGAGAAGGAAISYMLSKKHFEQRNPGGQWRQDNNVNDVASYRDRRGNVISKEEFERRRAQSERDRKQYWEQQKASNTQYRDKKGRFISKEEWERRQQQSAADRQRAQERIKPAPVRNPPKKLNINRWNKRRKK